VKRLHLGQATGNGNGIPPWTSIIQTPDNHFDADQLPEGFTLLDPSKMKDPQVQELLDFWYKQQVDGDEGIGFQFQSKATDEVRKRKRSTSSTRSDRPSLKRKEKGKGKAKQVLTWKDYIQPDSRRRTRRSGSVSSESSQEEFDFSTIDQESSDSDPAHNVKEKPGQSSSMKQVAGKKSWKERIVGKFPNCIYYIDDFYDDSG